MGLHSSLTGTDLHEAFHYVQTSDPGAVGAGKYWLDTSSSPYQLKRRNAGDSAWVTVGSSGGGSTVMPGRCDGVLTLESGVPYSTSDQTAKTSLYFTPYKGNHVSLYNGAAWTDVTFTELTLSLSGLTADTNYDVFLDDDGTTLSAVAWTNGTTRATALTLQDGAYVKSGDTTKLYLGTFRTTASTGQCEDSVLKRYVWNNYNRKPRRLLIADSTDSWTYNTTTLRSWNNSANNRAQFVIGLSEEPVNLTFVAASSNSSGASHGTGIGLDSTSARATDSISGGGAHSVALPLTSIYRGYPGIGYHYLQLLEIGGSVGTTSFYGDAGLTNVFKSGAIGEIWA